MSEILFNNTFYCVMFDVETFMKQGVTNEMENLFKKLYITDGYQPPGFQSPPESQSPRKYKLEADLGFDQRKEVCSTQKYPLSCIGLLMTKYQGIERPGKGTGFLIGPRIVMTCAHNCFYPGKGKYKSIKFYPAIHKRNDLSQGVSVSRVHYDNMFVQKIQIKGNEEYYKYDLAILELEEEVGEKYGYLGVDFSMHNIKADQKFMMYGYSLLEESEFNFSMNESPGKCLSVTKDLLSYKESTDVGQSGGPIILERHGKFYAVGIHLFGDQKQEQNKANHLTSEKLEIINKWLSVKKQYYSIDLSWQNSEQILEFLASNKKVQDLQELILNSCMISQKDLEIINKKEYKSITRLDLSFNEISNEGIKFIKFAPRVKKISLFKNNLQKQALTQILQLHLNDLEEIDLGLNAIGDDEGFRRLYEFQNLSILKLSKIGMSKHGLNQVKVGSRLHTIVLSGNNIGDSVLPILSKWKNKLRKIDVSGNKITQNGFKFQVQSLKMLESLNLSKNDLPQNLASCFPPFQQLLQLNLSDNKKIEIQEIDRVGKKLKLKSSQQFPYLLKQIVK